MKSEVRAQSNTVGRLRFFWGGKCSSKNHKQSKKSIKKNKRKKMGTNTKTVANMVDINLITSIITLHINSLKSPIKRQRLSVWTQNQTQTICCLKKETHFKYKDTD